MTVGLNLHDVEFWFTFDLTEEDLAEKFPHIENWIVHHILESRKDLMYDISSGEVTMPNAYWLELTIYYYTHVCPWEADDECHCEYSGWAHLGNEKANAAERVQRYNIQNGLVKRRYDIKQIEPANEYNA